MRGWRKLACMSLVFGWILSKIKKFVCVIEFTAIATSSPLLLLRMVIRIKWNFALRLT